jgi:hypothetical protein
VPPVAAAVTLARVRTGAWDGRGDVAAALRRALRVPQTLAVGDSLAVPLWLGTHAQTVGLCVGATS